MGRDGENDASCPANFLYLFDVYGPHGHKLYYSILAEIHPESIYNVSDYNKMFWID